MHEIARYVTPKNHLLLGLPRPRWESLRIYDAPSNLLVNWGNPLPRSPSQLLRRLAASTSATQANGIFGKIGRTNSEDVILKLISSKCIPILLYGLESLSLFKYQLNSLDFTVNRFFYETV